MPATRVTLSSNAKQTSKTPLLIPASLSSDPSAASSIRSLVLKTAQSKLRIKKPARVYVAGSGKELVVHDDWKECLRDDVVLLVSAGEEYVGVKKEGGSSHEDANPNCSISILAHDAPVEQLALTQLTTTARTLPGIVYASGQPDLCPGTKYPVGAVFVSKRWIHPPLIGSDIGCGMAWYKTTLSRSQVDGDKGRKVAEKLRGLEGPWRTRTDREQWLRDEEGSCSAGEEWDRAVGTIGAGNHFAEIQVVESIAPSTEDDPGLKTDEVILLVHSGSRGYGGSILKRYAPDTHVSLEEGSEEMSAYMEEHDRGLWWAKANRDLIALRFLSCLEPGDSAWELGRNALDVECSNNLEALFRAKQELRKRRVVDIWHNNLERVQWPRIPPSQTAHQRSEEKISKMSPGKSFPHDDYVFLHRKGAAPTYDTSTNLPLFLLPLPGSRGTPTMILKPVFSVNNSWGLTNALSLAHGAGRSMSRAKALSSLSQKYRNKNILVPASGEGTWVICDEKDLVYAYKNVHAVSDDLAREGVAEIVGWCSPRVSYKTRNEAR
ncbi:hypothetical protein K491DRAFT_703385 [Lophiostoma macrostomum CBS 122681]|uniref:3'-phosphate/5'-hydroxy nucleic acid ligase n=1 Tax=Lophiostoma macrostomum CBS 122681 TaxID=1314788 RepID=A0A6A6TEU1_9PLEO|nr:hypothetical protein K491DRAFT_703385 [Lophiostoma macrostomum CBS 122681]